MNMQRVGSALATSIVSISLMACGGGGGGGGFAAAGLRDLQYTDANATYATGTAIQPNEPILSGKAKSFSVDPALPIGLALDTTTGVISGNPTLQTARADYRVTAENDPASVTATLSIEVLDPLLDLRYTDETPTYPTHEPIAPNVPSFSQGVAQSFSILPALPAGLSLDPVTGVIEGFPVEASASQSYVVTATNAVSELSLAIELEIRAVVFAIGGDQADRGTTVATFSDGSFVVAGVYQGRVEFGSEELFSVLGSNDVFIARYERSGALRWVRSAGGSQTDAARSVATFQDGSCVLVGFFSGNATFGSGEANETTLIGEEGFEVFVARFASDGDLAWARRAGGDGSDQATAVAALSGGQCAVAGNFEVNLTLGPGEPNEVTIKSDGIDLFVARYDEEGNLVWATQGTGTGSEEVLGIDAFSDDDVVICGFFTEEIEIDGSSAIAGGSQDMFVARLNSDGSRQWLRTGGGSDSDISNANAVVALPDGSSFVTGFVFGDLDLHDEFVSGTFDAFFAVFDSNAATEWVEVAQGAASLPKAADLRGDVIAIVGDLIGTVTFGSGQPNETTLTETGSEGDAFVLTIDSKGVLQWAKGVHGLGSELIADVAFLSSGAVVVLGTFQGETTFGAGQVNESTLISDLGTQDAFVAVYSAAGEI